jgi:opacity protein-like surface antigen
MKKFIFMVLVTLTTLFNVQAEESGDVTFVPQIAYATKHSMIGIGAQAQFNVTSVLRIAPDFFYFIRNNNVTAYGADINVQYLIPRGTNFSIYPLAGFAYMRYKTEVKDADGDKYDEKHDRIGANFGVGAQYQIQEQLQFFTEERFQLLKDFNQSVTVLGVRFTF